jgi:hypothetical protein
MKRMVSAKDVAEMAVFSAPALVKTFPDSPSVFVETSKTYR